MRWLNKIASLLKPLLCGGVGVGFFLSCSPTDRQAVDSLNSLSYACHYRSLDSTEHYAQQAFSMSASYADGRAEALNNLAFVRIAQMRYEEADALLAQIPQVTDNQLELLVAFIQQMRLCQRTSQNRAFYDRREQALRALRRIDEELPQLNERQQMRRDYAASELAIVTSAYYYYVGLESLSAEALYSVPQGLERDTAQYLNYLYNVGSGGMVTRNTQDETNQVEFDHLMRCYLMATNSANVYFVANSLEALAEHLMVAEYRSRLMADNLPAMKFLNPDGLPADSLPLHLASRSLNIFTDFGDVYQIAGAHRTLASCYLQDGNYEEALHHLHMALQDTVINKAPDLVASIREQLSVAYAAIDDKPNCDYNRNLYLDLQEQTRQDRSLEARAGQLEQASAQLSVLIWAVVAAIVLLIMLLLFFFFRRRRNHQRDAHDESQQEDSLREQLDMARLRVEKGERMALEQRARISLVNGITPLIDRILHEVERIEASPRTAAEETALQERIEYITELTDNINEQNDVLTRWIQLRQGQLSLHIETFALQQLFDIVALSRRSFAMKQVELKVEPTQARVKADRVLTLFMLNTLADNARKFTPAGGQVTIHADEADDYVEISVSDTGIGMNAEQLEHVFERKVIVDESTNATAQKPQASHGFGLLNCKGIIEKYRKMSRIFSVCLLAAESTPQGTGEHKTSGSRFFFRLPKGLARTVAIALMLGSTLANAEETQPLSRASAYADSAYFSNVNGSYERTLHFADSCRHYMNIYYRQQMPQGTDTLQGNADLSTTVAEIAWLRAGLELNYDILLSMRNESAVAALALHQWQLYHYNNRIYTQLFKELSADATLTDYCRKMQQSQTNKQVAIILLVLLFVSILVAVIGQVLISLGKAARRQQEQQERMEMARDELTRVEQEEAALHVNNAVLDNCLSTLKHETMYYPSRIRQLLTSGDTQSLHEVAAYYRELYGMLSLQATKQTEHVRLHLKPLEHEVLGDPVLIGYLYELLRKQGGGKKLDATFHPRDDKYILCTVNMPLLQLTAEQAARLFTPSEENIPYLLCRQIVRDHGEATNRRACAIRAEMAGGTTQIIITLPRAKRSKEETATPQQ